MRSFLTFVSYAALLTNSAVLANDSVCLLKSATFGATEDSAGVIFETFGFFLEGDVLESIEMLCGDSPEDCDLEGTGFSEDAKNRCSELGGKLFLEDIAICSRAIKVLAEIESPEPPDVNFKNIPVCLDPTCDDDMDLFAAISGYLTLLEEGTSFDAFRILLDPEQCKEPIVEEPEDTTSVANARHYRMASSGLVALAFAALLV